MKTIIRLRRGAALSATTAGLCLLLAGCGAVQISGNNVSSGSGPAGSGEVETETGQQAHPHPVTRLEIDSDSGRVTVRPGPDGAAAVGHTSTWSGTRPELTQAVEGDTLRITARCPDRSAGERCEVDLTVTVPAATTVRTKLGAGGIEVSDLAGDQDLSTSAGKIRATGLRAATVTARGSAGSIELEFATPPRSVDARSSAGSVSVYVPRSGPVYRVEASTSAGDVDVQVPDDPGADPRIAARSSAGDVTVGYR
ncbi:DUF4097 family beta strand repeat-containing protein [Pseudonocardia bannensis]|uniref:DUF4097 domain-containing protein n=1 Tax=Pseudonocardia bannensis TaxID=630973 RepID=A0A848DEV2_9PSEU|nr:DUF4097 family beta strand repeat-containing protein [Pseudonocardia bannensis]NMH91178.1 DUF4097 domain-containing protein [Pseudonocardia bannensis]